MDRLQWLVGESTDVQTTTAAEINAHFDQAFGVGAMQAFSEILPTHASELAPGGTIDSWSVSTPFAVGDLAA